MTHSDPGPDDRRERTRGIWGAIGLFIVGAVVALALVLTLFGPTNTQQAINAPPPGAPAAPTSTP